MILYDYICKKYIYIYLFMGGFDQPRGTGHMARPERPALRCGWWPVDFAAESAHGGAVEVSGRFWGLQFNQQTWDSDSY